MAVELALPVANWQNKTSEERTQDIASVALEWQGEANIYWLTSGQVVRLTDTNKTNTETGFMENTATFEIVDWMAYGESDCLAWISALKDGVYTTTRLGLKKKYTDGRREIRVLNVDVYLEVPPEECVRLYSKFAGEDVEDLSVEDFRDRPVEFNLPEGKTFNDLVREFTGKTIAELTAIKTQALSDGAGVEKRNRKAIESAGTIYEQIVAGARAEQELIELGYRIDRPIGCPGISNREALKRLNIFGVPEGGIGVVEILNPDRYTYDKYDKCKKCEQVKLVASSPQGCGVCRDCQIKFDSGEYE